MQIKYQNFKKSLFNKNINKKTLFLSLKVNYSFSEQKYIIPLIPKTFSSLLYGNTLPHSVEQFGCDSKGFISNSESELKWLFHGFNSYASEISYFIEKKKKFENSFLLGKYSQTNEILNEIKAKISLTYWGLENRFLNIQYEKGLEFNFKFLNICQSYDVKDPSYFYLIHFFSNKVEEDISIFSYENRLNSFIDPEITNAYKEYFTYKLNFFNYKFESYSNIIWASSNVPVLDKYLMFRDVCCDIFSSDEKLKNTNYISEIVDELDAKIKDDLLTKLKIIETGSNKAFQSNIDEEYLNILDLFTIGKYDEVIVKSKQYLLNKNVDFSVIELYVKSHLHLNIEIKEITESHSLLNLILNLLYQYLDKKDRTVEASIELATLANAISNFDFSKELYSFLERSYQIEKKTEFERRGFLYSKSNNPNHYAIFDDIDKKTKYLNQFDPNQNNLTCKFFKSILLINEKNDEIHTETPSLRVNLYKAKQLVYNKKYDKAIIELENIGNNSTVAYLNQDIIALKFACYVNLGNYNEALNLFVNSYIINQQLNAKVNTDQLNKIIIDNYFKNITHSNINFPIFVSISNNETHAKFIAYDLFMRSINLTKPSEIFTKNNGRINSNEIFFLNKVAIPKIISRKAIYFKNSNEVLKERILICQSLAKADKDNADEYNKEISEITQRLTVQQRIKEIDQSKIYVDENGLIISELNETRKSFNRYKNISELLKQNKIDATQIEYGALYDLLKGNIDTEEYKKSLRKTNLHFDLFIQLFLEVRDKFLFSNQFGLDYYLSQRIRHGSIINQLRKSFLELNLITSKNTKDGNYTTNRYWLDQDKSLPSDKKTEFENILNEFSKNIDNIIFNLKDKRVQIKTEDPKTNQLGWFDYSYISIWHSDTMYDLFLDKFQFITDFPTFCIEMFDFLWSITTRNLNSIRALVNEGVKKEIIGTLDKLELDLKSSLGLHLPNRLIQNIATCRTNVQSDIDVVIRWFNKSKNDEVDFELDDAFNTSLKIVHNINSPLTVNFNKNIQFNKKFKGQYFTHFVDLLKIFITNIFDYENKNEILDNENDINIFEKEGKLNIEFINPLAEGENIEQLELKVQEIVETLHASNYHKEIRGEGNTGFNKATNIIKSVFLDKENDIRFNIDATSFKVICEINYKKLIV